MLPLVPKIGCFQEVQKSLLVIALQVDGLKTGGRPFEQEVNDLSRLVAPVDVVAEVDQPLLLNGRFARIVRDLLEERAQQVGTTVDVADRVKHVGRPGGGVPTPGFGDFSSVLPAAVSASVPS